MSKCGDVPQEMVTAPVSLFASIKVDLKKGNDIALHFNPRFNEEGRKVIVCNTMLHNTWGKEDRTAPRFPFEAGKPFKVREMGFSLLTEAIARWMS